MTLNRKINNDVEGKKINILIFFGSQVALLNCKHVFFELIDVTQMNCGDCKRNMKRKSSTDTHVHRHKQSDRERQRMKENCA